MLARCPLEFIGGTGFVYQPDNLVFKGGDRFVRLRNGQDLSGIHQVGVGYLGGCLDDFLDSGIT